MIRKDEYLEKSILSGRLFSFIFRNDKSSGPNLNAGQVYAPGPDISSQTLRNLPSPHQVQTKLPNE